MPYLNWIDDEKLHAYTEALLITAQQAQLNAKPKFGKNVIDPFAALFEIAGFNINYDNWVKNETTRQAQKTLQNAIGNFHQNILASAKGWENLKTGKEMDVVSMDKRIIAEVKNKYNTISGGKLASVYYDLEHLIAQKSSIYKGFTAYYVVIIPKTPMRYNKPFTPSDRSKGSKCATNENIREIDGASFYELVSGEKNALKDLYSKLPIILSNITGMTYEIERLNVFINKAFQ